MRSRILPLLAAAAATAALAACGSAASSTSAAAPASQAAKAAPAPSAPCRLKITFDYIERTTEPGLQAQANEIGNVDFTNCTDTLSDFQAEAGQGDGECTKIALASKNPGYDASAVPAPSLKAVIASAGPGCAS